MKTRPRHNKCNGARLPKAKLADSCAIERVLISYNLIFPGCNGGDITPSRYNSRRKTFSSCENMESYLEISKFQSEDNTPNFSKLKRITGFLEVMNSNFHNLSFLESLESIGATGSGKITVHDNPEMTGFGIRTLKVRILDSGDMDSEAHFQKLKYDDNYLFYVYSYNLHPDFCLTIKEMAFFLDFNVDFFIQGRYCQDLTWSQDKPKMCTFSNMKLLDTGCVYVYGHLLIESGDEDYVEKLRTVTHVLGSVTVRNTRLESFDFLEKLRRVANLNGGLGH